MQNYTEERDAVLSALTSFLEAIENKDAQAAIRWFDTQAVTFDLAPPLENRFDALSDPSGLEAWFNTWDGPIHTDLLPPTVLVSGDIAVVHGLQRMHGKKKDGDDVSMWYRATAVLASTASGWRISHLHNSVPMAMDGSQKALTDLTPP